MQAPSIPMPARLAKRPTFQGMPIPFSTYIRPDGTPDFKVTDHKAWTRCAMQRLCGVCGERITGDLFFIAGEKSIESGLFFDPAMHEECAKYSFQVCPFLAGKKGYAAHIPKADEDVTLRIETAVSTERPKRMGILRCKTFKLAQIEGHEGHYFFVEPQFKVSTEWKD